ncbi:MAG: VOC family protein [Bacteroidota bacterium]
MVKFAYTILYVQNVTKTIEFYERAFGFTRKFITPENDYGEVLSGETTLAFAFVELAKTNLSEGFQESDLNQKVFGIELGFTTEEVEKTVEAALQAGATLLEAPKTKPWGQTVSYVRDLDGFLIEICTPMEG